MANICLDCVKAFVSVLEVGDVVVEKEKCSNCKGQPSENLN